MSNWSTSNPEEATRIAALPPPEQNRAERAAIRLVPAIRCAMESDLPSDDRIPFSTVDPSGLIAMSEFLQGLGFDVDEVVLGKALAYYLEVSES